MGSVEISGLIFYFFYIYFLLVANAKGRRERGIKRPPKKNDPRATSYALPVMTVYVSNRDDAA